MLGPLVNPSRPKYQMVGVFNQELQRLYQYILQQTDTNYAIVHALDGYDEISLTGDVKIKFNHTEQVLSPKAFGFPALQSVQLFGGDSIKEAADIFMNVLNDTATDAQKYAVIANSAVGIQLFKPDSSLGDCVAEAAEAIESKRALACFQKLV
jgi:anthranilate phosphoribosyltransferase